MKRILLASWLGLVVAAPCLAAPPTGATLLRWPALSGFRSETYVFPLDFAPEIVHRGTEELRFAPGWSDPKAPDYFTYAFTWLLQPPGQLGAETLHRELQTYFSDLMASVAREKHLGPGPSTYVRLDRVRRPGPEPTFPVRPSYRAQVTTWDAFHGGQPLILNIDIFEPKSPVANRDLYYFEVSPHSDNAQVRDLFLQMRRQLQL